MAIYKTPTASAATVNATSSAVLAANNLRRFATIANLGSAAVYLGIGAAAVAGTGPVIPAGGSVVLDVFDQNKDLWLCAAVNGITDGSSIDLAVMEVNR